MNTRRHSGGLSCKLLPDPSKPSPLLVRAAFRGWVVTARVMIADIENDARELRDALGGDPDPLAECFDAGPMTALVEYLRAAWEELGKLEPEVPRSPLPDPVGLVNLMRNAPAEPVKAKAGGRK